MKRLRLRALTENVGWKLLALAVAVLLWLSVGRDPELVSFVSVPVQYQRVPSDLEISSDVIEHVYLELQGTAGLLDRFADSGTAVTLDLSGVLNPGERTFNIDEDSVRLPLGMKLVRAVPSQLRFGFEYRSTREVKVEVRFTGKPPAGYRLESFAVSPRSLTIVGPESRVSRVEAAQTDPVDLGGVVASSEFRVNAFIDDPHVRFQGSPRITVRVIVGKI